MPTPARHASWVVVLVLLTLQASFLLPPVGYALLMTRGVLGERVPTRAVARRLIPYLVAQLIVFFGVFAFPGLVHIGQRESEAVAAPAATLSDEEVTQRMREMIAPPPESDENAAQDR